MSFLLDTNIVSAHISRPRGLVHRFTQYSGRLYISTIALAELYVWVNRALDPSHRQAAVDQLLRYEVNVIPYEDDSARIFGQLRLELQRLGAAANAMDLLIASVALAHDLTLVTHNVKHFDIVPGLRVVDWLSP